MTHNLLRGKVAIVTGGARGVGKEAALGLAEAGADIALIDRCRPLSTVPYALSSKGDLAAARNAIERMNRRCLALEADVVDLCQMAAAVDAAAKEFGHIDILVANAGVFGWGKLWELSEAQWDEIVGVNLKGTWVTLKSVVPLMLEQRFGRIICVSSTAGLRGWPNISHYAASKHGVVGLVRSLAMEVGAFGITVNAVCPTFMKTGMVAYPEYYSTFVGEGATEKDLIREKRAGHLLPVDFLPTSAVREAIVWLSSEGAQHITGVALPVDAGEMLI
jgi:SDR family mycofactocin-dependent oxidoreductase